MMPSLPFFYSFLDGHPLLTWFRNGRMGLGFRITHLMGLQGFLMIWVGFQCWIIN